ncbi:hypothetical protein GEMMAAP_18440 [Gemmatimonas phototrophica]|uniref:Uncharacterized protein n=1 Tax=Gemmatimonas phototrophica TaxID=1379270 RepID=A0A143BMI7_9BACT|nr:hypothetical protein GEMMAAP_18440 [Gemmatimonas phototrophica]
MVGRQHTLHHQVPHRRRVLFELLEHTRCHREMLHPIVPEQHDGLLDGLDGGPRASRGERDGIGNAQDARRQGHVLDNGVFQQRHARIQILRDRPNSPHIPHKGRQIGGRPHGIDEGFCFRRKASCGRRGAISGDGHECPAT